MHHDKKVGLGLGILLVGIVSAFFFRQEPQPQDPLPELQSAKTLDAEIANSLVDKPKPYTELEQFEAQYKPAVNLQGIEAIDSPAPYRRTPRPQEGVFDEEFEFLNDPPAPIAAKQEKPKTPIVTPKIDENNADLEDRPMFGTADSSKPDVANKLLAKPKELPVETEMFSEEIPVVNSSTAKKSFPANEGTVPEVGPRTYRVQSGDTLSEISSRLLGTHLHYRKIFEANRDLLKSPNDLRPGMLLTIPGTAELHRETPATNTSSIPAKTISESRVIENQTPETPRVIVPKRVRLQTSIARADETAKPMFSADWVTESRPSQPVDSRTQTPFESAQPSSKVVPRSSLPQAARTSTSDAGLPSLDGLEPLPIP